jgi:hypothetical protein
VISVKPEYRRAAVLGAVLAGLLVAAPTAHATQSRSAPGHARSVMGAKHTAPKESRPHPGPQSLRAAGSDAGVMVPAAHRVKRYNVWPSRERYRYESVANHPDNPYGNSAVRYLDGREREAHRVYFDHAGVLRSAKDGTPFDSRTVAAKSARKQHTQGHAIFVMDRYGNFYASLVQTRGVFHHTTFLAGQPTAGSGEMVVTNGRLEGVYALSGHYLPGFNQMWQIAPELRRMNVRGVPIYGRGSDTVLLTS